MTLLRAYLALSLDGYIADAAGGVGWLDPYFSAELDFAGFQRTIGAVVVGRKTFDQGLERDPASFAGTDTVVLTRRPLGVELDGVRAFAGDVRVLADELRAQLGPRKKDVWLMGGGESIRPFHEAGLVDRWELYFIPELLGDGVPLFPRGGPASTGWKLARTRSFSNGILEAIYERAQPGAP